MATVTYFGGPKANTTAVEVSPATFTIAGEGTYTYVGADLSYYWSWPAPGVRTGVGEGYRAAAAGNLENIPRLGLGEVLLEDGALWLAYFSSPVSLTIDHIGMVVGSAGSATPTLMRMGLYVAANDDSVTLVARTANDTTVGATTDVSVSAALATTGGYPATYRIEKQVRYAFGTVMKAATTAKMRHSGVANGAMAPVLCRRKFGETDLATSYAVGALTAHVNVPYFYAPGV